MNKGTIRERVPVCKIGCIKVSRFCPFNGKCNQDTIEFNSLLPRHHVICLTFPDIQAAFRDGSVVAALSNKICLTNIDISVVFLWFKKLCNLTLLYIAPLALDSILCTCMITVDLQGVDLFFIMNLPETDFSSEPNTIFFFNTK